MTLPMESLKSLYASFKLLSYLAKNLLETMFSSDSPYSGDSNSGHCSGKMVLNESRYDCSV